MIWKIYFHKNFDTQRGELRVFRCYLQAGESAVDNDSKIENLI